MKKQKKEKDMECRKNTTFIRVYKTSREKLRKLAKKFDITMQELVESYLQ